MKLVSVFTFFLLATLAAGQAEKAKKCMAVAQDFIHLNPDSTCAYIEDAVMCAIKVSGWTKSRTTQAQLEGAKATVNAIFRNNSCSQTSDDAFNEIKAMPELLELTGCIETAVTKIRENNDKACTYVEEAVECGLKALTRSDKSLKFVRAMATRYLTPYRCTATFDSILERVDNSGENSGKKSGENSGKKSGENSGEKSGENSGKKSGENSGKKSGENSGENLGPTVSPTGWLTAFIFMVAFIATFTTVI